MCENLNSQYDDDSILSFDRFSDQFYFKNQNNWPFENPSEVNINEIVSEEKKLSDNQIVNFQNSNFAKFPKNQSKKKEIYDGNDSTNIFTNKKPTENPKMKEKKDIKKIKKKAKKILINVMPCYVNYIIKKVYGGKIGQGIIHQKIIRNINPSEKENITIKHNRKLLKKTLKDILSNDISKKYTSILILNINKKIIDELLNEENEEKRQIFTDLFNKTFLEWVLMLSNPEGELKHLYEQELYKGKKKDENEINKIDEMIKNFEKEFLNKKNDK